MAACKEQLICLFLNHRQGCFPRTFSHFLLTMKRPAKKTSQNVFRQTPVCIQEPQVLCAQSNSAGKQLRGGRATARATGLDRVMGLRVDGERQSFQSRRHVATHPSESGLVNPVTTAQGESEPPEESRSVQQTDELPEEPGSGPGHRLPPALGAP